MYPFIISYSCLPSFICITPLHLTRSSPYWLDSNNTCSSVSTCPHPQQSSSYFHAIISLLLTGRHPHLTISLTLAPTLPSANLSFIGHIFHFHILFLPFCIIEPILPLLPANLLSLQKLQMYLFHTFLTILIPRLTIPFTLTSINNIRLTNSISPNKYISACILPTILMCILFQSNMLSLSLTSNYLQTPIVTSIPPSLLLLSLHKYSNLSLLRLVHS